MVYFYEKIDLLFEVFSPYELRKNKKRLLKNIDIWICKSLFENEVNHGLFEDLVAQVNARKRALAKQFSLEKIPSEHLVYFKVRSPEKVLQLPHRVLHFEAQAKRRGTPGGLGRNLHAGQRDSAGTLAAQLEALLPQPGVALRGKGRAGAGQLVRVPRAGRGAPALLQREFPQTPERTAHGAGRARHRARHGQGVRVSFLGELQRWLDQTSWTQRRSLCSTSSSSGNSGNSRRTPSFRTRRSSPRYASWWPLASTT